MEKGIKSSLIMLGIIAITGVLSFKSIISGVGIMSSQTCSNEKMKDQPKDYMQCSEQCYAQTLKNALRSE